MFDKFCYKCKGSVIEKNIDYITGYTNPVTNQKIEINCPAEVCSKCNNYVFTPRHQEIIYIKVIRYLLKELEKVKDE